MFHRRPIGRGPGRPASRAKILLQRANRMLAEGAYLPAGEHFQQLAEGALRRRIPRAPFLFLQAGRAYLFGGEHKKGVRTLYRGLNLLKDAARWDELYRVGRRTAEDLADRGYEEQAREITEWIDSVIPKNYEPSGIQKSADGSRQPVLPTHCPQCGGAIDPKAISWMDKVTGECLYCGSPVRAESQ